MLSCGYIQSGIDLCPGGKRQHFEEEGSITWLQLQALLPHVVSFFHTDIDDRSWNLAVFIFFPSFCLGTDVITKSLPTLLGSLTSCHVLERVSAAK